jgi:hypothetical protein
MFEPEGKKRVLLNTKTHGLFVGQCMYVQVSHLQKPPTSRLAPAKMRKMQKIKNIYQITGQV